MRKNMTNKSLAEEYPDNLIRGLIQDTVEDGIVLAAAFQFKKNNKCGDREEISINWHDNDEAISITFSQKKKDTDLYQFPVGVAILSKNEIDKISFINYERDRLPDNPYHGNIFYEGISTGKKRLLAGMLSRAVIKVIYRN